MRASTQAGLLIVVATLGMVATLIDGVSDGFSAWNVIAILAFAVAVGGGLGISRRVP